MSGLGKMAALPLVALATASLGLAGCRQGELPPESRCTMYWDYYYNAGLGKPIEVRRSAEGVEFDDIRRIVAAAPSDKAAVCRKILADAFPEDPALRGDSGYPAGK